MAAPNDPRRPDPRREVCEELAELLSTEEGQRTARALQLTQTLVPPGSTSPRTTATNEASPFAAHSPPKSISLWQPRSIDGRWVFERPEPLPLGDHHAARRRIDLEANPDTTRICLFGESVAAGYLYAPRLTPAMVLAAQLAHFAPKRRWEVVDLARTNERIDPLVETAERSLQLRPQHWVVFWGNNWNLLETSEVSPYFPSVEARQRYAQELRRNDLDGPVELARTHLAGRARAALARLARLAREAGIHVTLIIPESHLEGWEVAQPIPWLPQDLSARWYSLLNDAQTYLGAVEHDQAAEIARRMMALDEGRSPTSHRLLTRALLASGAVDAARQSAQEAVDRGDYATLAFLGAPQASSRVQDLLRSTA